METRNFFDGLKNTKIKKAAKPNLHKNTITKTTFSVLLCKFFDFSKILVIFVYPAFYICEIKKFSKD